MLATILKSPRATQTTIAIIDSFVKLREAYPKCRCDSNEPDLIKQKGIVKRTGQLLSDLLIDDADTTENGIYHRVESYGRKNLNIQ